jgi:hypothetical protein
MYILLYSNKLTYLRGRFSRQFRRAADNFVGPAKTVPGLQNAGFFSAEAQRLGLAGPGSFSGQHLTFWICCPQEGRPGSLQPFGRERTECHGRWTGRCFYLLSSPRYLSPARLFRGFVPGNGTFIPKGARGGIAFQPLFRSCPVPGGRKGRPSPGWRVDEPPGRSPK